jgi:hypothetical protein
MNEIIIKIAGLPKIIVSPTGNTQIDLLQGSSASRLQATYNAGEAIAAFKVVALVDGLLYHASVDNLNHLNSVLGISLQDTLVGQQASVVTEGIVTYAGWNWADDTPLFLDLNGDIAIAPDFQQRFLLSIGNAPSPNQINLSIDEPTLL